MTYEDIVRFGGNCQVCAYRGEALLRHCRSGCHRRCDLSLHRHEQRGTGREKEDHDGRRRMYFPHCSSPGTASVLRHWRLNAA